MTRLSSLLQREQTGESPDLPARKFRHLHRRALSLLIGCALALGLAGCAPGGAPSGPGATDPKLSLLDSSSQTAGRRPGADEVEGTAVGEKVQLRFGAFHTFDGLELPLRAWLPGSGSPRAVLLAVHGFNDYAHAFQPLGEALSPLGVAVYAYDQRGFGEAPHVGLWAGEERLVRDLQAAAAELRERYPSVPLVVLGESMGGAVVLAAESSRAGIEADRLILSAPAVWARETQPWYQRTALWLAVRTVPWYRPPPGAANRRPSDNIEMLRELARDPLVLPDARVDTLAGLVDLMDRALAAAPLIETPTLLLYGDRDEIIPGQPIDRLWQAMPAGRDHRYLRYPEGWHLLTRDLQGERVIADIASWIENPDAPLPSSRERLAPDQLVGGSGEEG